MSTDENGLVTYREMVSYVEKTAVTPAKAHDDWHRGVLEAQVIQAKGQTRQTLATVIAAIAAVGAAVAAIHGG